MAQHQLEVSGYSPASAASVWAIAGQFCAAWHPAIATMKAEHSAQRGLIRAFTVHGEDTVYREQLSYYSETDRELRYHHLQGIAGVDEYSGSMRIEPAADGGCTISCSASLAAPEPRAEQIAQGTRTIFQIGIDALIAQASTKADIETTAPINDPVLMDNITIGHEPALRCSVTPKKSGLLCIFLHGIGGGKQNWHGQLAEIGNTMQAVALDLRGYGESEAGDGQSTIDDYCNDILRVREAFNADDMVLCGLSYGAWIATSFAIRYPQMLRGLVLSGGCTGMSEASADERDAFRNSREVPLNAGQTPADFAPDVVNVISGPHAGEAIRQQLLESMADISTQTYRDALNCFTHPPERFDFSRLAMPVLMMTGEHDRLAPPAEIRSVATRIHDSVLTAGNQLPDVQFEIIDGAGHVCNLENPQQYNNHLGQFLARVDS